MALKTTADFPLALFFLLRQLIKANIANNEHFKGSYHRLILFIIS